MAEHFFQIQVTASFNDFSVWENTHFVVGLDTISIKSLLLLCHTDSPQLSKTFKNNLL